MQHKRVLHILFVRCYMFLDFTFLDFIIEILPLNYVFVAFCFYGICLSVQYLILRKRL